MINDENVDEPVCILIVNYCVNISHKERAFDLSTRRDVFAFHWLWAQTFSQYALRIVNKLLLTP